jgi:hypothetical protein
LQPHTTQRAAIPLADAPGVSSLTDRAGASPSTRGTRMGQRGHDLTKKKGLLQGIEEFWLAPPNAPGELQPTAENAENSAKSLRCGPPILLACWARDVSGPEGPPATLP